MITGGLTEWICELVYEFISPFLVELLEGMENTSEYAEVIMLILHLSFLTMSKVGFNLDSILFESVGGSWQKVYDVVYMFGVYVILLKFAWKAFNTYILQTDGDPDADPIIWLTNLFKALIVALSFGPLYEVLSSVLMSLMNELLWIFSTDGLTGDATVGTFALGLTPVTLLFMILFLVLLFLVHVEGLKLLILRTGVPLACSGFADADGGVAKPYFKKFFQLGLGLVMQLVLAQMALYVILYGGHVIIAIVLMWLALTGPSFLSEFMTHRNVQGATYGGMMLMSGIRGFIH